MRIAFDFEKTIISSPRTVGELMGKLVRANNDVFAVATDPTGVSANLNEGRIFLQLKQIGIYPNDHFKQLIILSDIFQEGLALKKAQFCRDEDIDIFFEGDEQAAQKIKDIAPKTLCFVGKATGWD